MDYQAFLLKYGEIAVKGDNRHIFEDTLVSRVGNALEKVEGEFRVRKENGRIYAECLSDYDFDEAVSALKKVFGIVAICPVLLVEDNGFEALKEDVIRFMEEEYGNVPMTFKVESRRARKNYPLQSPQISSQLGEAILGAFDNYSVNVHEPDVELRVEIRNKINIYSKTIKGCGGMPTGTAGKAMLLLSGGIDSPVAGYMIAKRGVKIAATYFHAPPYTSERAKEKVVTLAKKVAAYAGSIELFIVNFTEIQLLIYKECPHDQLTIIMRRYMMRIAEHFARENDCLGLITGESIGQVASQTMRSLFVTDEACTMPVYRPLIGFDKQDIVDLAEEIDTYETSILPYEDCCTIFVAKHPVTKPVAKAIHKSESHLEGKVEKLIEEAISTAEVVVCK